MHHDSRIKQKMHYLFLRTGAIVSASLLISACKLSNRSSRLSFRLVAFRYSSWDICITIPHWYRRIISAFPASSGALEISITSCIWLRTIPCSSSTDCSLNSLPFSSSASLSAKIALDCRINSF
jgi:hypothetical protein